MHLYLRSKNNLPDENFTFTKSNLSQLAPGLLISFSAATALEPLGQRTNFPSIQVEGTTSSSSRSSSLHTALVQFFVNIVAIPKILIN